MRNYRVLAVIIVLLVITNLLLGSLVLVAASDSTTIELYVKVKHNYDNAYQMLELVNKEREANGVKPLKMDESLMESAMTRAAELSVRLNHERPNGRNFSSINEKISGENFTSGQIDALAAMENLLGSPGHKANMLTSTYSSIGIGHVEIDGINYWVQLFSPYNAEETETELTGITEKTYSINLLKDLLSVKIKDTETMTLNIGEKGSRNISNYNSWIYSEIENNNAIWSSSNRGVAVVNSHGEVTAINSGKATITAKIEDQEVSYDVYVPYEQLAQMDFFDAQAEINIQDNSSNVTSWDYIKRDPENTILDNKKNLNFIYCDNNYVYIQRLDANMQIKDTLKIQKRYSVYGTTIIDNSGNYYIAWGQNDTSSESTGKITFAISKYDNFGKYISSYEKTDSPKPEEKPPEGEETGGEQTGEEEEPEKRVEEPTKTIFANGTCNMDINSKGIIAYNYSKETKNGNQCNSSGYINSSTMLEAEDYNVYSYTSHAWATDVKALNTGEFLFLEQGDSNPRAYNLSLVTKVDKAYVSYNRQFFHFREGVAQQSGYKYTFSNYGSIEDLKAGITLIASAEKTLSLSPASSTENESRNIFMQVLKKDYMTGHTEESLTADSFITVGERKAVGTKKANNGEEKYFLEKDTTDYGVQWLTNYFGDYTIKNLKTVEIDLDRVAIFYTVTELGGNITENNKVYYMIVNNEGDIIQKATLLERGVLPGNAELVYNDGYVYFTNSDGTKNLRTYRVKMYETQDKTVITVDEKEKIVNNLDKFNINAVVNNNSTLEYKTTNTSILEVSSDGTVTPKKEGEAEVIISVKDAPRIEELRVKIIIDNRRKKVTLDNTKLELKTGALGEYLKATVSPLNADTNLIWSSSNENVATIEATSNSSRVKIVPKNAGNCTITVYPEGYGDSKVTCNVTIINEVTNVEITESQIEIKCAEKYKLNYTVKPDTASNKKVTWTSSNTKIVTVDETGTVTGVNDGNTTVIARSQDNPNVYDICHVTVDSEVMVTNVNVSPTMVSFSGLNTKALNIEVLPQDATNKKLEYSSENTKVATVSSSGVIQAKGNGTTKITIKTTDGSNIIKAVDVNVNVKCTSIYTSKEEIKIEGNVSTNVSAYAMPSLAANTKLSYSIKDITVATIDQNGLIKPIKNGTTIIVIKTTDGSNITKEIPLIVTGINNGGDNEKEDDGGDEESPKELPFTDVKKGDWYYTAVEYTYQRGIIKGATDTEFRPTKNITRGMIVTILWRMEGEPKVTGVKDFPDVTGQYYYNAVRWAVKNGVVNGYNSGKFGPNDNITREQLATILCNYAKYKKKNVNLSTDANKFTDWYKISGYAKPSMDWAIATGVITGKNNGTKVDPQGTATRAEATAMIYNYCIRIK